MMVHAVIPYIGDIVGYFKVLAVMFVAILVAVLYFDGIINIQKDEKPEKKKQHVPMVYTHSNHL
jgi:hypothetical protein